MKTETVPEDRFTRTRERIRVCSVEMGYDLDAELLDRFALILMAMSDDAKALVAQKFGTKAATEETPVQGHKTVR